MKSEREETQVPLTERLKPIQDRFASLSKAGGLPADKTFFDELSGGDTSIAGAKTVHDQGEREPD